MGATALLAIDVGSALSLLVLAGHVIRHREQPWAVTRLGGDCSIESDGDGSAVVLEIPDRGGDPVES